MPKPNAIVLDSWAVMAYLKGESASAAVADAIADAQEAGVPMLMSVVNAGEVWYIVARLRSSADADQAITWLKELGVKLIDADWPLTRTAAGYKTKGKISYADCYAAALARQKNAYLLTGDTEFAPLEQEIAIRWLT